MALVATMVARALMTWNSPVRVWIADRAGDAAGAAAEQAGDEQAVEQLHALGFAARAAAARQNSSPPPSGYITRARSRPRVGRRS